MPPIRDAKARMREAVVRNVEAQKVRLQSDVLIAQAMAGGPIKVAGAFYEIGNGAVDFLDD